MEHVILCRYLLEAWCLLLGVGSLSAFHCALLEPNLTDYEKRLARASNCLLQMPAKRRHLGRFLSYSVRLAGYPVDCKLYSYWLLLVTLSLVHD